MEKVTVIRNTGIREQYTPEEFYEAFRQDNSYYVDMVEDTPVDTGRSWTDSVLTDYAIADWDDLVLAELPSGVFIETGKDLNDRTFDEDGNNVRPYVENGYYITTDDGQDPAGSYVTAKQAYEEELKDLVEAERVRRYGAPDGYSIESGADLNAHAAEEDGNTLKVAYDDYLYYITTDDGQNPVGGFETEYEAIREAWHMAEA